MAESSDYTDPAHGIPVFIRPRCASPVGSMMDFDCSACRPQDLGCRVYTFVTTLRYVLEAAAERGKELGCSTGPIRWAAWSRG